MTLRSKLLTWMALPLVCAVIAGCGGGDAEAPPSGQPAAPGTTTPAAPDKTAPTMTIASDVSADVATGPVTFTFVFSEDVGISFEATDIVVAGGAPSAFTRVGGSQATVIVTPPANANGTINLSVAAGKYADIAGNLNAAATTASKNFNTVIPGPTTAAPTPPARAATDVLSVYSDAYTQIAGVDPFPNWGQSTVVSEVLVAGNKTRKYANLNYEGTDWSGNPINVSAMSKLHLDFWTKDVTSLKVSIISNGKENAVTLTPALSSWNSVDIDLAQYTVPDKTAIIQLKIEGTPAGGALYLDNIYFWKAAASGGGSCGTTAPTCAPSTAVPAGATTIYSDAASAAGFNPFPNWGQPTQYSEATIASNKSLKYTGLTYEGIEFAAVDVSSKGKVHFDFWSPDLTSVKVSIISAGKENAVTKTLTTGTWNSIDIDLSSYTVPDLKAIIQIKLETVSGTGTLYVDNIYFWGTAATGGGGSAVIFASNYSQINASTWKSKENGDAGNYIDTGVTTQYWWNGVAPNDSTPSFYFGFGTRITAKPWGFGAFVKAPANGTANVTGLTNLKIAAWGNDELMSKKPTLTLILKGPAVAGCTSELMSTVAVAAIGVQNYTVPLSGFTLQTACAYANAAAALAAGVTEVHVQVLGSNVQYVTGGDANGDYPNGLNVGPISFN